MFANNITNKIKKLFSELNNDDEFEIMFNNFKKDNKLSLNNFIKVMKYLKYRSREEKMEFYEYTILDIINRIDDNSVYRVSIKDIDNINKFLNSVYQKKNNQIISVLFSQYSKNKNFEFIKKIKDKSNIIDIDEFDIRFRVSKEQKLNSNEIENIDTNKFKNEDVIFRYKQRLVLKINENSQIDLTIVKTNQDINKINTSIPSYELEIDYSNNLKKPNEKELDVLFSNMEKIKKVIENSEILISIKEREDVIKNYTNIMFDRNTNFNNLYSMQPVSVEVQHIIDNIPNVYAVTDKAEGTKYQLFVLNNECYLLSNNLDIKKLSIKVNEIDLSVFEGELIYLTKEKKYVFMIWDCLYFKNKDVRNEIKLQNRLKYVEILYNKIYSKDNYKIKSFSGDFSINKQKGHYQKEIENYFDDFNNQIERTSKNSYLIYPKLFLFPLGGNNSEVFMFSSLVWYNYTINQNITCPYKLDGIIYTGLNQIYSKDKKSHKYPIYKYKPPSLNSLDVYIKFEMNKDTGKFMDIFDNSIPEQLEYSNFRVTNFYVGNSKGTTEVPVLFMPEENNHQVYLPIVNGQVRDINGDIILDGTVIEVIYNNNNKKIPHQYRWSVLRTRWDKTDSVNRYNKKYGNFYDFAIKIWKSMIEAVTIEEINNLACPDNYNSQMKILSSRLTSSVISTQKKQDIYYQKISNLCKKMREFHGWIKSIIIYTYCAPTKSSKDGKIVRQSILDIGCGRGGDILKYYHSKFSEYVGVDIDLEGIYSSSDGAISRYNYFKNKFPNFGKVTFLQADASIPFDKESQEKKLTNMSEENKKGLSKTFTKNRKFDIFSSQFSFHFLCGSELSLGSTIENINKYLKKDGYLIFTVFDSDLVNNLFDKSGKFTSYYTDEDGKREVLFEIIKKYSDDQFKNRICNPIDVHMAWINEKDKYIEEYLLHKDFLVQKLKKAGCVLVETDLFLNLYNINKQYFTDVIQYEQNDKNKKYYSRVSDWFKDLKGPDRESKTYSNLSRYYIFKKEE